MSTKFVLAHKLLVVFGLQPANQTQPIILPKKLLVFQVICTPALRGQHFGLAVMEDDS